jgi:hypothetical protein
VLGGIVSALILGSLSPKAALDQMRSNLQTYADTPSPLG